MFKKKKVDFPEEMPIDIPEKPQGEILPKLVRVTVELAHVRAKPSMNELVVGYVTPNDILEYAGEDVDGWHKILVEGKEAWISGECSEVVL